jgi:hypothetical protein
MNDTNLQDRFRGCLLGLPVAMPSARPLNFNIEKSLRR